MLIGAATLTCLCAAMASGTQVHGKTGKVEGAVVVRDLQGNPSSVPSAKISLRGPAIIGTETDEDGKFSIASVPYGTYQIEAVAPGLAARQTIHVGTGEVHLQLDLKLAEVSSSVVVKADASEGKTPAPSETIGSNTLLHSAWREYRGKFVLEF